MNKNLLMSLLVVVLFIAGVYLIIKNSKPKSENMENTENMSEEVSENNSGAVEGNSGNGAEGAQLSMVIVTQGTGDVVSKEGDVVSVNYVGAFEDGKIFDSSVERGIPFEFTLGAGQVIKGWDMGVVGMKIGEKRRLVIPSDFAYGPNDYGPIPGGSTLIFDVELVGIK